MTLMLYVFTLSVFIAFHGGIKETNRKRFSICDALYGQNTDLHKRKYYKNLRTIITAGMLCQHCKLG